MKVEAEKTGYDLGARFVGFMGALRVAAGALPHVAVVSRRAHHRDPDAAVLIFDRETAEVVDLDLRGTARDIVARLAPPVAGAVKRGGRSLAWSRAR